MNLNLDTSWRGVVVDANENSAEVCCDLKVGSADPF